MRLKALKSYLVENISPKKFYDDFFGGKLHWSGNGWTGAYCPFHNPQWKEQKGKSPSFSIREDTGAFRCHSPQCEIHGKNVVNFYDQFYKFPFQKTLRRLYRDWVEPTISAALVEEWHQVLMDSPSVLKYITQERGLSKETVKRFRLGFDGTRISIPVENRFGLYVDIRRYDFTGKMKVKMLSYQESYGGVRMFPMDSLLPRRGGRVLLCEGEWDAMVAIDRGYRAVTVTGGAGGWPEDLAEGTDLFTDVPVRIVYDVNDVNSAGQLTDAGQIGAAKIARTLAPVARSVKVVKLPIKKAGGDITDFLIHMKRSKSELDALIEATPMFGPGNRPTARETAPQPAGEGSRRIRLDEAADARYYYKPIEIDCLISGKDLSPYLSPKKVRIHTKDPESGDVSTEDMTVDTRTNKLILRLVNCTHGQLKSALCEMFDVPMEGTKFEVLETFNMEELRIIPAIDLHSLEGTYTVRRAVYVGHGLEPNKTYRMKAYTLPNPDTQSCVHVITEAEPVQDTIENFAITPAIRDRLQEKFCPREDQEVRDHMFGIARWLSRNVTKIKKRPDLHIAVDLVFHSPLTFTFNEEEVTKGWLELLVIGDTRCGKGYVAERMSQFYRLGETVTGENCSFPGLIGGLQKNNDHWFVTWGKVPQNDKRLVIIDEASAISVEEMGKFSRVRSEGIAEIIKIITERTRARTRLIWLANSRSGRPINTYNNGVEAVAELFGNMEDIARLDFALTVATAEVASRVINAPPGEIRDAELYSQDDFTNLVLWAWSRKRDQVEFTPGATELILRESVIVGKRYSASIPLVQAENIRIKLAKLSAATAARCFSSDETGEKLIVKSQHVRFACEFLEQIYSKPSMGYDTYSSTSISRNHIMSDDAVVKVVRGLGRYSLDFIEGILEQSYTTAQDVSDFTGMDRFEVGDLVGKLVRLRCLSKEGEAYVKRPGFVQLLREMRLQAMKEGP